MLMLLFFEVPNSCSGYPGRGFHMTGIDISSLALKDANETIYLSGSIR